ncbi:hypothetical protein Pla175_08400 [Pirellulimonas nuda]|uniref:DUF885 domain-containing protein n=1 Tax=Pirellulimonas nuda TaxID=2528009 RepID=A0A518D7L9_9BACT|nr:DUF885 domain-containing protein [Pirellulimonas nuda]QDU87478.1 hypothetical protein Pla175_08400 [Pirellulimonas nuda]
MPHLFCSAFLLVWLVLLAPATRADKVAPQQALDDVIAQSWAFDLAESPEFATRAGVHDHNDRLDSARIEDFQRRASTRRGFLDRLNKIDRGALSPSARLNYDLLRRDLTDGLSEHSFRGFLMPISNRGGFHIDFPDLPKHVPLGTVTDLENYIARLRDFGRVTDEQITLMRIGTDVGMTVPAVILEGWEDSVTTHIVADPTRSALYEPLKKLPDSIPAPQQKRLRAAAAAAIAEVVSPAYQRFYDFMKDEYVPNCRSAIGASALPNGREFYRHRVRMFTTLDTTPDEVHMRGLAEVKRIRGEMEAVIEQLEFDGDFKAFVQHLRDDPEFYAKTPEELLQRTALVLKRADGQLPKLFGRLPRTPYGIREIPAFIAPKTTSAYYMRPGGDGKTAGFYYVNTYNLPSRGLFDVEALSLHEAVPGHHLQLALQQELEGLPEFRKYSGFTAFIEGWGLYAERLGLEMGFYEDPYSNFGRLNMEMWRACRLVVDTGMHYLGWSREQAIKFMLENSPMSEHNIRAEVDRYIGWPGQALAYKTGELKIRELRARAEEALGDRFDIRAFHDVVLGSGAVPLDVLEANVDAWVAGEMIDDRG